MATEASSSPIASAGRLCHTVLSFSRSPWPLLHHAFKRYHVRDFCTVLHLASSVGSLKYTLHSSLFADSQISSNDAGLLLNTANYFLPQIFSSNFIIKEDFYLHRLLIKISHNWLWYIICLAQKLHKLGLLHLDLPQHSYFPSRHSRLLIPEQPKVYLSP